jgi:hypothetical protein
MDRARDYWRLALVVPCVLLDSCSDTDGSVEVVVSWAVPAEARPQPGSVWIHGAVLREDGSRDAETIVPYSAGAQLSLVGVTFGSNRRIDISLRETESASSDSCCQGTSEPFDLLPDETITVEVLLRVKPVLRVDQSLVSWVRAPQGRGDEEALTGDFSIPAGPYFGVAPSDDLSSTSIVPAEAFTLLGGLAPSTLQFVDGSGALLTVAEPDDAGNWPRAQMSLGQQDPERVFVRATLDGVSERSEPIQIESTWYVTTSLAPSPPGRPPVVESEAITSIEGERDRPLDATELRSPDGDAAFVASRGEWRRAGLPSPRLSPGMVYDSVRDRVVMYGGARTDSLSQFDETWEWDGQSWTRIETNSPFPTRSSAAMTFDSARGRAILFGGLSSTNFTASLWEYDGSRWLERDVEGGPSSRSTVISYDSDRQRTVVFGGVAFTGIEQDTWEWDGEVWHEPDSSTCPNTDVPSPRSDHHMAYDAKNGTTVLFGGFSYDTFSPLGDTWLWDGQCWTEAAAGGSAPTPRARNWGSLVYDPVGERVLLYGGQAAGEPGTPTFDDMWAWDGVAWSEVQTSTRPPGRFLTAAAFDEQHRQLVIYGGRGEGLDDLLTDMWSFDGSDWTEITPPPEPVARYGHAMVFQPGSDRVLLFGGGNLWDRIVYGDTWEWDGSGWLQRFPVTSPSPRYGASMAYDSSRNVALLFGGRPTDPIPTNDTWEWDGQEWRETASEEARPPARTHGGLVYDEAQTQVVLFGGDVLDLQTLGFRLFDDTWVFDGSGWREVDVGVERPEQRTAHGMAYDSVNRQVVMFGGDGARGYLGDTWVFDGERWTRVQPERAPSPRSRASMAFDRARGRVVLTGGSGEGALLNDTWEWTGTDWTEVTPPVSPSRRMEHKVAYDEATENMLLFGGFEADTSGNRDLFKFHGDTWIRPSIPPPIGIRFDGGPFPLEPSDAAVIRVRAYCASDPRGAELLRWDGNTWVTVARNDARTGAEPNESLIDALIDGPDDVASTLANGGPRFMCRGRDDADSSVGVEADYVEARVLYRNN